MPPTRRMRLQTTLLATDTDDWTSARFSCLRPYLSGWKDAASIFARPSPCWMPTYSQSPVSSLHPYGLPGLLLWVSPLRFKAPGFRSRSGRRRGW